MSDRKVIQSANPNLHGPVELVRYSREDGSEYNWDWNVEIWRSDDDFEADFTEFGHDEAKAREFYLEEVARLRNLPNWDAQAEYDEKHGTDNGYAPHQQNWEY